MNTLDTRLGTPTQWWGWEQHHTSSSHSEQISMESMDLRSLLWIQPGAWLLLSCYQQNSALFKAVASLVCSFHCSVIFGNSPTISSLRRTGLGKLLFLARKYFKYRHPCCNWIRGMLSEHHPKSKSLRAQQKDPRTCYNFFFLVIWSEFCGPEAPNHWGLVRNADLKPQPRPSEQYQLVRSSVK